ncbi:gas vesicle protein [Arthrobacter hankyongi]|uniref:gas vesicle protein n=1 Tax=Arthrobacter hankyongi TaxID=2904801 RepID=UPI0027DFF1AF|nr:gas vesicle protein [Arthrobacter hankyongi]
MDTGRDEDMQPTRDPQATLSELVDALLNKGVYLDLDLVITVADIPLIGISLRAAIAGMETMLEYGMMNGWDERTRAWVRDSVARQVLLRPDEDVVAGMAGGYYWQDPSSSAATWRQGRIYLTTERLIVCRREPPEVLWQAALGAVSGLELRTEPSVGGAIRTRLLVRTDDGAAALLSAAEPARLKDLVRNRLDGTGQIAAGAPAFGSSQAGDGAEEPDTLLFKGDLWYQEIRATGPVWRGGTGRYDVQEGFTWQDPRDRRPAIRLQPDEITAAGIESAGTDEARLPAGISSILILGTAEGTIRLASARAEQWAMLLRGVSRAGRRDTGVPEVDDAES